ncbi:MAG TPA: plastocyanin/azurin family copper-binding protein [Bacteroidota bacterium]|nr:plastocyanin/azurin family copper-binding protein [Bacteroidota bacterium]
MRKLSIVVLFLVLSVSMSFATSHKIMNSGTTFSPATLTIAAGDTVVFSIASIHNAVEVSQATWNADGITSNGGFSVPFGGGTIVLSAVGTHYFVCQAHASMGMKGIITVTPAAPPPSTITIQSFVDQDSSLATTSDRLGKAWTLTLYQDSIGSGIVLGSDNTTSLTVPNLSAGTYVALESDSVSWSHISVTVDGSSKGYTTTNQWTITIGAGESHTIQFFNFAEHTVINIGETFFPDTLFINPNDTVRFVLESIHDAAEVSQATWLADGTTSNGGFLVPFGGGTAVISTLGIHYYVCQAHATDGMKGIIVAGPLPPSFLTVQSLVDEDGNPATTTDRQFKKWSLTVYKNSVGAGNVVASAASGSSLTTDTLKAGTYVAVESDSTSWSHLSVSVNGASQGATSVNTWTLAIGQGEDDTIGFVNFARHTIINSGTAFFPDSLFVTSGDTVRFALESDFSAQEVSQAAWLANDTTSNGGFDTPLGGGSAILTQVGTHYYVCLQHASSGMKGRIMVTPPPPTVSIGATLMSAWNMISLPVSVSDARPTSLFPDAVSLGFGYAGRYVPEASFSNGYGYWLKFGTGQTDTLTGIEAVHDSVLVDQGWNMIGSITFPIATATIRTQPGGIISSPFFGYNSSYFIVDTLRPAGGYWVKVSQAGALVLDSASTFIPPAAGRKPVALNPDRLIVTDATGRTQTLYIMAGAASTSNSPGSDELPPIPPSGGFDVRFYSGTQTIYDGGSQREVGIEVLSAAYPLQLRWDLPGLTGDIALNTTQGNLIMRGSGSQTIGQPGDLLGIVFGASSTVPNTYALEQAYPNPFNPTTSIQYSIPVRSQVLIRTYNLLGQVVATLVSGIQDAGTKSYAWNAGDLVSGVYFVRMNAVASANPSRTFEKVMKVVLQK